MLDSQLSKLELNSQSIQHFNETRKWTMFLSVAGFIFIGLMVLVFGIAMFSASSLIGGNTSGAFTLLPLILIVGIYFFPIYFLYQFSSQSKQALETNNSELLAKSLKFLKYHYRFMGILFIIFMGIYAIMALVMAVSGGFSKLF
jgi:di/tricarboxylate transporter